jgi:uncharacterized protein YjbI with pentapeptide repeats
VEQKKESPKRTWQRGGRTRTLWSKMWDLMGLRGKTAWDWLQLFIVPLALAVIGFLFAMQQDARQQKVEDQRAKRAQAIEDQRAQAERELEEQRAQDTALQAYLDQMSTLLIEKGLRKSEESSAVRTLAQARTTTVIQSFDAKHNQQVMHFLTGAALTGQFKEALPLLVSADLQGADLEGAALHRADLHLAFLGSANLSRAWLKRANLSYADLQEANLSNAQLQGGDLSNAILYRANLSGVDTNLSNTNLSHANLGFAELSPCELYKANLSDALLNFANLSSANLNRADLSDAYLVDANLSDANLFKANLSGADLGLANLEGADLEGADLYEADLTGATGITAEELDQQAKFLNSATLPNGQKYEDWLLPAGKFDTYRFEPAFHFEVGEDWDEMAPETTDEVFLGTGPKGGTLLFTNPLHVFDSSNPSEPKEVPAPENAAEWVSWFQSHPNLDTSKSVPVSVGDASGKQIDVTGTSTPENYPKDRCGNEPCVPLYPTSESAIVSYGDWKDRFAIVDVGGDTVVINVAAPAEKFDEFLPKAQKVLDSVEWKGENSGPS